MHFKGKVAIVTGGSSGIGKETAKRLVAHGASVVLSGRDEAKLRSAAKEISPEPAMVRVFAGDIGKPSTGTALVDMAEKEFGGLDVLVSNAGVFKPKPFLELTEEEYDWFLDTILKGKFFLAQAAAKAMKKRGGGVDCPYRFAVGPTSHRRNTLCGVFSSECGGARTCSQSCVGIGCGQDQNQCRRPGRGRDSYLLHFPFQR